MEESKGYSPTFRPKSVFSTLSYSWKNQRPSCMAKNRYFDIDAIFGKEQRASCECSLNQTSEERRNITERTI